MIWFLIAVVPILLIAFAISIFLLIQRNKRKKNIVLLSKLDVASIVNAQQLNQSEKKNEFNFKLIQSGITLKEYNESRLVFILIGLILAISFPILFSTMVGAMGIGAGLVAIFFGGQIYLAMSKSERVEKIDEDLGVFLDLVNVILEAGGSLKNAFFTVSTRAKNIVNDELLKEIGILEYEMTNYSTKQAYANLKNRVDSPQMDKIVDFLILSEETGIGVKNIFMTQSTEMRQEQFYQIKGKVSTLNMYLMIVIFIFILPAVAAFVIFPMRAGIISIGI